MWYRKRFLDKLDPNDFSEKEDYSNNELEAYATAFLRRDRKESGEEHGILFEEQIYNRHFKREILVDASEIDGTLTNSMQEADKPGVFRGDNQKIYNRTHPQGRKMNTDEARAKGGSFYRT